jgi:hypothetical protein
MCCGVCGVMFLSRLGSMGLNRSTLRFVANTKSRRGLGSTDYDLYNCTIIVVLLNDRIEASPQSRALHSGRSAGLYAVFLYDLG